MEVDEDGARTWKAPDDSSTALPAQSQTGATGAQCCVGWRLIVRGCRFSHAGIGVALLAFNGGLDVGPEVFRRIDHGKQLPCRFGDRFQVGKQSPAQLATADVRVGAGINTSADQFGQLGLKFCAVHFGGIAGQDCASGSEF
jgi:hypothetical protein